jgi:hypothetical protein
MTDSPKRKRDTDKRSRRYDEDDEDTSSDEDEVEASDDDEPEDDEPTTKPWKKGDPKPKPCFALDCMDDAECRECPHKVQCAEICGVDVPGEDKPNEPEEDDSEDEDDLPGDLGHKGKGPKRASTKDDEPEDDDDDDGLAELDAELAEMSKRG